jgi:hypothetical protein
MTSPSGNGATHPATALTAKFDPGAPTEAI